MKTRNDRFRLDLSPFINKPKNKPKTKYEAFMDFIELIIHKSNNNYTSISRSLGLSDSYISGIKYRRGVSDAAIIKTLNKYNSSKFRDSEEYKNLSKYVLINKHTEDVKYNDTKLSDIPNKDLEDKLVDNNKHKLCTKIYVISVVIAVVIAIILFLTLIIK